MNPTDKFKETNLFAGCNFNLKVFEVIHNQYAVLRLHWHDYPEILYFVEGTATLNIGSSTYEVSPGDILFLNRKQLHSGYSPNHFLVKYYAIVIDPSFLAGDMNSPDHKKFIQPFMEGSRLHAEKLDRKHPYYGKIKNHIKEIIHEYKSESPGFEIKIRAHLSLLVIDLFRGYVPVGSSAPTAAGTNTQQINSINALISHIYVACPMKITLSEAADFLKLSPYYFCKVFKKVTGSTFTDFINIYKIRKAEELLLFTDDSISSIAYFLGFCNTNYFDKVFKQHKGISPSAYRKRESPNMETYFTGK